MDLFEAIEKRHTYRGHFADKPMPRKDLQCIVQAGLRAPSGRNAQTTRFVIVDDAELVRQIAQIPGGNAAIQTAQAFIVCFLDDEPEAVYEGHQFQVEDCAAAVENMLLAITALGYASVWTDGWLRLHGRAQTIGQLLKVPAGKTARILLPIGRPSEVLPRKEKAPFEERAWFNQYATP